MIGKPAKILSRGDVRRILNATAGSRRRLRNRVIVLLSVKAGLRASEIAALTWDMVSNAAGRIGPVLELPGRAAKKRSGRRIPLHPDLRMALVRLRQERSQEDGPVIVSERGGPMTAQSIVNWFAHLYR